MEWAGFALAYVTFFLTHSLPIRPPLRPRLQRMLGQRGFTVCYSVLSLCVLTWLIVAAGRSPRSPLWEWAPWHNAVALVLMLLVCLILAFAAGRPNPFSFGGGNSGAFDPARPGIVRLTRHPILVALGLWAAAHLLANGDLAHVILFGTFAIFAALGGRLVERRIGRDLVGYENLKGIVMKAPIVAPGWREYAPIWRALAGIALWFALLGVHGTVIGVSPIP